MATNTCKRVASRVLAPGRQRVAHRVAHRATFTGAASARPHCLSCLPTTVRAAVQLHGATREMRYRSSTRPLSTATSSEATESPPTPVPPPVVNERKDDVSAEERARLVGTQWQAAPEGAKQKLAYTIQRTKNGSLPVYRDIRNGRTRKLTIVRKYKGSSIALMMDLRQLVEKYRFQGLVSERPGRIEIKGDHKRKIVEWMMGCGF